MSVYWPTGPRRRTRITHSPAALKKAHTHTHTPPPLGSTRSTSERIMKTSFSYPQHNYRWPLRQHNHSQKHRVAPTMFGCKRFLSIMQIKRRFTTAKAGGGGMRLRLENRYQIVLFRVKWRLKGIRSGMGWMEQWHSPPRPPIHTLSSNVKEAR